MSSVTVVSIISDARTLLNDADVTRWTSLELQKWLNAAYREIINLRPDANAKSGSLTCVAGARQNITSAFASALRLLDVVRNVAATSQKNIVTLIDRASLDSARRGWPNETQTVDIEHYVFDPRLPKEFMVYPPATAAAQLEVVYSELPTPHALTEIQLNNSATAETIRIDDTYANAILDYVLFRAFSKDAISPNMAARAAGHLQSMQLSLGVKTSGDDTTKPKGAAQQ